MPSHDPHDDSGQASLGFASDEDQISFRERLNPFVAPVASNSGAVAEDSRTLEIARAVYAAFGDDDAGDGLTRGAMIAACVPRFSASEADGRINQFIAMDLLLRQGNPDQPHQVRYCFNPAGVAALLVFDRVIKDGGVQEITLLLTRTWQEVQEGLLDHAAVLERITQARHGLVINTSNLLRLVRSRTVEELLAKRRDHRSANDLLAEAKTLVTVVADRFPELAGAGQRLIRAASRYCDAVSELWDRLLDLARTRQDFSMLSPEQYRTAAQKSSLDELADVFVQTVFDPASASISVDQILEAVDDYRPRPIRRRPPRTSTPVPDYDPVAQARERAARTSERRMATIETHMQGRAEVDLTSIVRGVGWPRAAELVVAALMISASPEGPFAVRLSTALLADPAGEVSYFTPLTLRRNAHGKWTWEKSMTDAS